MGGTLGLGSLAYKFGPHLVAQMRNLNTAVPAILQELSSGRAAASLGARHGLTAAQQLWLQNLLARHHDFIARSFDHRAAPPAYASATALCLFSIPILSIP